MYRFQNSIAYAFAFHLLVIYLGFLKSPGLLGRGQTTSREVRPESYIYVCSYAVTQTLLGSVATEPGPVLNLVPLPLSVWI